MPNFNFEAGPSGRPNVSYGHESGEAEAEFGRWGYDHRYGHPYGHGRFGFGFRRPFGFHGGRDFGGWRGRGFSRRWPWLYRFAPGVSVLTGAGADPSTVAQAQACLAQILGSWVPQDGRMNSATQQAIQSFQAQQQLPVTGALDDNTMAAIQAACSAQTGSSGSSQPPQTSEY
ncbi:MAG TPA: peptidoglycan-binding domain-containing protein [Bryobacteraceae bacterium]|nr:peptidoglycan-binding domain-containing protein [Bryobacteraceae bacterium]